MLIRISESASLGIHAMAILARHQNVRVSSREMAKELRASEHTLAPVFLRFVKAGWVSAIRGAKGGFKLAVLPQNISVLDIYEVIEGASNADCCLLGVPVCNKQQCALRKLTNKLNREVLQHLREISLADLSVDVEIGDQKWPVIPVA